METDKKRNYKTPQLREVKLIPEEAVLAYCRTAGGRGVSTKSCTNRACSGSASATGAGS